MSSSHRTLLSPHLPSQIQFLRLSYYLFESLRAISLLIALYYCLSQNNEHSYISHLTFLWLCTLFSYLFSASSPLTHHLQTLLSDIFTECHEQLYLNASSHISVFGGNASNASPLIAPSILTSASPAHNLILNFTSSQASSSMWRRAFGSLVFWVYCMGNGVWNVLTGNTDASRYPKAHHNETGASRFACISRVRVYAWIYKRLLWGKDSSESNFSPSTGSLPRKVLIVLRSILTKNMFYMTFHSALLLLWIGSMVLYMRILPFQSVLLLTLMQPVVFYFIQSILGNIGNHRSKSPAYTRTSASFMNLRNDFVNNVIFFVIILFAVFIPHKDSAFLPVGSSSEFFSNLFALLLMFVSNMSRALYRNHTLFTMRKHTVKSSAHTKKHHISAASTSSPSVTASPQRDIPKSAPHDTTHDSLFRRHFQSKQQYDNFISFTVFILLSCTLLLSCIYYGPVSVLSTTLSSFWPALAFVLSLFTLPSIIGYSTHLLKASLLQYENNGGSGSGLLSPSSSSFAHQQDKKDKSSHHAASQSEDSFVPHHDATNIHLFIFSLYFVLLTQNVHILTLFSLALLFIFFHRAFRLHRKNAKMSSSILPGGLHYNGSSQSSLVTFLWSLVQYSESYLDATTVTSDTHIFNKVANSLRILMQDRETRNLFVFLVLTVAFMFVELVYGLMTDSLGLISDAAHMFFDSASLFVGLYGQYMVKWQKDKVFSYGYGRYEILSGFINGLLLVFISVYLVIISISRIIHPPRIEGSQLLTVSVIGFLINVMGVINFYQSDPSHENQNIYGVYLHMIADALGSLGVILSTILIQYFQVYRADPLCSFAMSILILMASVPLLKHNGLCLMQATPTDIQTKLEEAVSEVSNLPEVDQVTQALFWTMNQNHQVGTLKIQLREQEEMDAAGGVVLGAAQSRQVVLQKAKQILSPLVKDLCIDLSGDETR